MFRNTLKLHKKLYIFLRHYSFQSSPDFRSKFGHVNITNWFPGHMYRGMLQLQAKLAVVDCVIEVHDARIPFSGRNPNLYTMLSAIKPHILVLNKCDLIDVSYQDDIKRGLLIKENIKNVLFTNCKENKSGIQKIVPLAKELIKDSVLYNRGNRTTFAMMVVGIPNVGKSSVINRLRNYHLKKKSASAVGAVPGVTKSVLEKIKISDAPDIFLYDSPGIMQPSAESLEIALKLAVCRTIKESIVGVELIADYLLYWLNKHKNFSYVEYVKLKEPVDDIRYLLVHIAKELNKIKRVNNIQGSIVSVPDTEACAFHFVRAFRDGKFGKVLLDIDYLSKR